MQLFITIYSLMLGFMTSEVLTKHLTLISFSCLNINSVIPHCPSVTFLRFCLASKRNISKTTGKFTATAVSFNTSLLYHNYGKYKSMNILVMSYFYSVFHFFNLCDYFDGYIKGRKSYCFAVFECVLEHRKERLNLCKAVTSPS